MKDQIDESVRLLEKLLLEQKELTEQLIGCGEETEKALIGNDLPGLRKIVEKEEELAFRFGEKERARLQAVRALIALLDIREPDPSLKEIGGSLPDPETAACLQRVGEALGKSVARLQKRSRSLRELLMLKSDYTDMMLRLLSGSGNCRGQSYDGHGDRTKPYDGNNGMYEVLV